MEKVARLRAEISALKAQLYTEKVTSAYWKDRYEKTYGTNKAAKFALGYSTPVVGKETRT